MIPCNRSLALAAVFPAVLLARSLLLRQFRNDSARLQTLWNSAAEVLLDTEPGRPISWMVPTSAGGSPLKPPASLRTCHHFALTAFNPPGVSRTLEENTKANEAMWKDLRTLSPKPLTVFRAFGFNLQEAWREDGFCLCFPGKVDEAREAVLRVAAKFEQGAIFEYPPAGDNVEFTRVLVYVDRKVPSTSAQMQFIVPPETGDPVIQRPWAGPHDLSR